MVAWRLLAVLVVVGAALVVLTLPAGAEDPAGDGGDPTLAAHEIQWTRYPAKNTERNKEGFGNAVWGGGSFLKVIGKLAIEGCDVNAIAIYDSAGEELLYLHHFQAPDFVNADFGRGEYLRMVPAGSVLAFTCVDACNIFIGPGAKDFRDSVEDGSIEACMSVEEYMEWGQFHDYFDIQTGCIDDFRGEIVRQFLPIVPMLQDVCVVYFSAKTSNSKIGGVSYNAHKSDNNSRVFYKMNNPFIVVNSDNLVKEVGWGCFRNTNLIMHELCHQQQYWYANKFYNTYDAAKEGDILFWDAIGNVQALAETVGFKVGDDGRFFLEESNRYFSSPYYNHNPLEFAAELCANYVLQNIYDNEYLEIEHRAVATFFLTDELIEWVEEYMIVD